MNRPEQALQQSIVEYLQLALRPDVRWWHTPSGGWRSKVEAAIFKGIGAKAGVPDLCFAWSEWSRWGINGESTSYDPVPVSRIAFIEVKAEGGKLSFEQRQWQMWCEARGIPHAVVRSLDEAIAFVKGLGLTREVR